MPLDSATPVASLGSIPGEPVPESLGADLLRLADLPEAAQGEFWQVLVDYLAPELDAAAKKRVAAYCERHDLRMNTLAPAVRAARFMFRGAARSGASQEAIAADLLELGGDDGARLVALMLPWFEDLIPKLRVELLREAVSDHGRLLTGSRWRMQHVRRSDRLDGTDAPVCVVTLNYREGERDERITLHMLPDQLDTWRQIADEVLG